MRFFAIFVIACEILLASCIWFNAPHGTHWLGGTIQNTSDIGVYFSYLAQGKDGNILLDNRYAVEPHALRFDPVWSLAGLIARTGIPFVLLHEILRWIFTIFLVWAVYAAARSVSKTDRDARLGTILAFGGIGLGSIYSVWLHSEGLWSLKTYAAPDVVTEFGIAPILMGGAHMILSLALLLIGFRCLWIAWRNQSLRSALAATASLALLSAFHPYFSVTIIIFYLLCLLRFRTQLTKRLFFISALFSFLAALPTIAIYLPLAFDRVFRTHHLVVNVLPLPPLIPSLFTLFPFLIAFAWRWKKKIYLHKNEEWLIAFILSAVVCILLPFPWKRKYLEGFGVALVLLTLPAWIALRDWILRQRPWLLSRTIAVLLLVAACLTPLHLFASQIAWIDPSNPQRTKWFYVSDDIFSAWTWLHNHTDSRAVILSDDMWINLWTPAYANRTVWVGHDHETPDFLAKRAIWEELFATTDATHAKQLLDATPVTYLLLTTTSTQAFPQLLSPEWRVMYQNATVTLLKKL